MKLFLDFEMTGLSQDTTPISLGIISEDGRIFYAEFNDYNRRLINGNDWIKENVIDKLLSKKLGKLSYTAKAHDTNLGIDGGHNVIMSDNSSQIKSSLEDWLEQFDEIEIWADVLAYDWILFCNIFGTAMDIPKNIYYIPFDLATLFKIKNIDPDIKREEFVDNIKLPEEYFSEYGINSEDLKHNSLYDAFITRECYNNLMNK